MFASKKISFLLLACVLVFALAFSLAACDSDEPQVEEPAVNAELTEEPAVEPEPEPLTELVIEDVRTGEGPAVKAGDTVVIDWAGYYIDGMMWNSSSMTGQPSEFIVGDGDVIEAWDVGVVGMKVGGERTLLAPSDMAFGEEGAHPMVAPNQDLKFVITLLEIQ